MPDDETDVLEDEEIVLEVGDSERRIRVYDRKGDFIITVPAKATITFGYFNPASPKFATDNRGGWDDRPSAVAKATALRIYLGNKTNQLACFIGVQGFRDESIGLTRLSQRVVIETGYTDDGEGNFEEHRKQQRQIVAAPEPDTYQ